MLDVCLMGCGGSMPKPDRWLSSAIMRLEGKSVVIDCGEGTQLAMKEAGFAFKSVGVILITHFHADHVSGLPGFLLSMGNEGRTDPVLIAGPRGISRVVRSLCVVAPDLPFEVEILEIPREGGSFSRDGFDVETVEASHTCPCFGYRIRINRAGKFDPEKAESNGVPLKYWNRLQHGETVTDGDLVFTPDLVLGPPRRGITVSYVVDTRPLPGMAKAVEGSDLLIIEGMFGEEKRERAEKSMHMTMAEAARIARDAGAEKVWLTHFSPSVPDPGEFIGEARAIFSAAEPGEDGMKTTLFFREDGESDE